MHQNIGRRPQLQEMTKYLVCNSSQDSRCILIGNSGFLRSNWDPIFYETHHPQAPVQKEANGLGSAVFLANKIGCRRGIREERSQTFGFSTILCNNTTQESAFLFGVLIPRRPTSNCRRRQSRLFEPSCRHVDAHSYQLISF